MTIRYVGIGGNDANSGLTWALRKATPNGAEDTPVVAGDTVYVGPGTYRETLTCDVSGNAGTPITYIGDYSGENTDGVGGVIRITGSDDDITATRNYCIIANNKDYRTFRGFDVGLSTSVSVFLFNACDNCIFDQFYFGNSNDIGLFVSEGVTNLTVKNSFLDVGNNLLPSIKYIHSVGQSDSGNAIENCIFSGGYYAIQSARVGGITIKNCLLHNCMYGVHIGIALPVGQTVTINNSVLYGLYSSLQATVLGEIIEDYNSLFGNNVDRTNVAVGGNSNTYPPLFDSRWFFEQASRNQKLVTPFDLSLNSQLIDVAGTGPTATDLRGVSVQGAQREWGALEYYANLSRSVGISRGRII